MRISIQIIVSESNVFASISVSTRACHLYRFLQGTRESWVRLPGEEIYFYPIWVLPLPPAHRHDSRFAAPRFPCKFLRGGSLMTPFRDGRINTLIYNAPIKGLPHNPSLFCINGHPHEKTNSGSRSRHDKIITLLIDILDRDN